MSDLHNLPDHTHYAYRVLWSPEDEEFVGLCAEFPSLSWLAPTQDQALQGIRDLVHDVIKDMAVNNEVIPRPLAENSYSGKFLVRVSSELHARLVREAAEMKVSLNQLANQRLASRGGSC
ncbi:type II toxin-antitoxin system HicB family antitoxin [Nocardia farcinica]|uniref:type II toxin-antitoxin system HicB family antitoxin n=1 Tax=Nocardia farcinica TaxID=37329 RepID=UPI001895D6AC|nr:toxin-antitoxin system HicB family antitoxin [Nocardia farcinica]MBF6189505.1 toxin-antitoxin system HicB family antitoxin [Nocardia farcinica]